MDIWKILPLGDVIKTNTSTYSTKENWKFVNYLDTGNITENVINNVQFIDLNKEKLPSRAKRKVKYNNIIYSTVRPNQRHYGIIKSFSENFLVSTGFTVIEVDEKKAVPDYIYFLLSQNKYVESLHAIAEQSVSAYPSIRPSDIEGLEVTLPPIDVQKKIASILLTLNEKMMINWDINKNLEEQLSLLYQNFFDTETEMCDLGTVISTTSGGTPSRKKVEYYEASDICWVKSKELLGTYIIDTEEHINDLAISNSSAKLMPKHTVLIAMYGATVGAYGIISSKMTCNQAVCGLLENNKYPYTYLFQFAKESQQQLINQAVGSAQQNISQVLVKQMQIHSNVEKIANFHECAMPIHHKIETLQRENVFLQNVRDTLLPKLMSGELDVSNINL